jgi:hypothetical protein
MRPDSSRIVDLQDFSVVERIMVSTGKCMSDQH